MHPQVRVQVRVNAGELVEPRRVGTEHLRVAAAPPAGEQSHRQHRDLLGSDTEQGVQVQGVQMQGVPVLELHVQGVQMQGVPVLELQVLGVPGAAGSQLRGQDPIHAEVRHSAAAASLHHCCSAVPGGEVTAAPAAPHLLTFIPAYVRGGQST